MYSYGLNEVQKLDPDFLLNSQRVFNATLMIGMIAVTIWFGISVVPYLLSL